MICFSFFIFLGLKKRSFHNFCEKNSFSCGAADPPKKFSQNFLLAQPNSTFYNIFDPKNRLLLQAGYYVHCAQKILVRSLWKPLLWLQILPEGRRKISNFWDFILGMHFSRFSCLWSEFRSSARLEARRMVAGAAQSLDAHAKISLKRTVRTFSCTKGGEPGNFALCWG